MGTGIREPEPGLIPWNETEVTFIRWRGGDMESTRYREEKREWLKGRGRLWAAWTGRYRTDIFTVDKSEAKTVLGE